MTMKPYLTLLAAGAVLTFAGCSKSNTLPANVSDTIRTSLNQANLKDVTVKDDTDKGVVTLAGSVPTDAAKLQAEAIARPLAGAQVVANQIAVIPPGVESDAKKMNAALDEGIESNLNAA